MRCSDVEHERQNCRAKHCMRNDLEAVFKCVKLQLREMAIRPANGDRGGLRPHYGVSMWCTEARAGLRSYSSILR